MKKTGGYHAVSGCHYACVHTWGTRGCTSAWYHRNNRGVMKKTRGYHAAGHWVLHSWGSVRTGPEWDGGGGHRGAAPRRANNANISWVLMCIGAVVV